MVPDEVHDSKLFDYRLHRRGRLLAGRRHGRAREGRADRRRSSGIRLSEGDERSSTRRAVPALDTLPTSTTRSSTCRRSSSRPRAGWGS
jgi:hypothetical protein